MAKYISETLTPAAMIGKLIKEKDELAKVVFIGPCTSKKAEIKLYEEPYIDIVITFEELQALFHSKDMDITTLEAIKLTDASAYGRNFAHSGGVTEAIAQAIKEQGLNVTLKPLPCNGIEECKIALLRMQKGLLDVNFIEGMACVDGCIGGAGNLTHNLKNKIDILKDSTQAYKTIEEAIEKI